MNKDILYKSATPLKLSRITVAGNKKIKMAINKNHEFEELDGVKCGIVEKNVTPERVTFLKTLLTFSPLLVA